MRRGALINRSHRQQALVNSILGRQPLVIRLTRHQQLPQALGLLGLPVSQAVPVSQALTDTMPALPAAVQNFRSAQDAADAKVEALPVTTQIVESVDVSAAQTGRGAVPEVETPVEREDIRELEIEAAPESLVEQREDVQPPISQNATELDVVQPLAGGMHGSTNTVARQDEQAARQVESLATDEAVQARPEEDAKQPIETVRPRRPRRSIEELPAQMGHSSPPTTQTTKKGPERPQRHVQPAKAQRQPEAKTTSDDGINADDLFLPTNTDRSPQAWLARLMGKSVPAQEETVADMQAATGQDLPPENGRSEAPVDKKLANVQPYQEAAGTMPFTRPPSPSQRAQGIAPTASPSKTDAQGQGQQQSQARSAPLTRVDTAESIAHVSEVQVPNRSQVARRRIPQQREETHRLEGQGQQRVEGTNPLRTVPGVASVSTTAQAARTVQARQPEQLSSRTRRFLRPLVGIDPASVQVHRDAQAARLTNAYHADAMTMGDAIELPPGNASETPGTLGLLAHELTHVARQRNPGFVPPILQTTNQAQGRAQVPAQNLATADEETLALQVERQVRRAAGLGAAYIVGPPLAGGLGGGVVDMSAGGLGGLESATTLPAQDATSSLPSVPLASSEPIETRRVANDPWNGLPAPWEPLPGWLTMPSTPAEQSASSFPAPMPAPTVSPTSGMASNGSNHQANGHAEVAVQRAGRERSIGEDAIAPAPMLQEVRAPEPDLDELARQVYSILRNRLEVERRRHR
jgi:hypothetical protein